MEDLSGGSLSLEQHYEIEKREGIFAGIHVYRGTQHPLEKPIWIHVIPHPSKAQQRRQWLENIRAKALEVAPIKGPQFYEILDFGAIEGSPFIVYARDDFHRLSEVLEVEGTLDALATELICSGLAEACLNLKEKGLQHGAINPAFVFLGDEGQVKLIQSGFDFSKETLDELNLSGLYAKYALDAQDKVSDAFGIACLTYSLLSGVHPFLDRDGDKVVEAPSHPAEFGVDMQFAEKIFSQFDPLTRDLYDLISVDEGPVSEEKEHHQIPIPDEEEEPKKVRKNLKIDDAEYLSPKRNYSLWAALVVIAILGLALIFQPKDLPSESIVRPTTLTLNSSPSESDVFLEGQRIGITPFQIDPKMSKEMKLEIRKEGYVDQSILISMDNKRPLLNVSLVKK